MWRGVVWRAVESSGVKWPLLFRGVLVVCCFVVCCLVCLFVCLFVVVYERVVCADFFARSCVTRFLFQFQSACELLVSGLMVLFSP